jgi:tRNA G46 methylase TrmB
MPGTDVATNACRNARATLEADAESATAKAAAASRYGDDDVEDSDAPSKSVQLFLQLRAQDALREIEEVEAYVKDVSLARREQNANEAMKGVDQAPNVRIIGDNETEGPASFAAHADVRVEVCSGHGDWITRKAKQDSNVQWVGVEMRRNRVALTWMKALRLGVHANLALICGMASDALDKSRMPANTASEVYVNYPDPPEWVGSSQVLVNAGFLRDAHRVLKPGGHLICVTDDSTYAMRMCRELHKVRALFAPDHPHVDGPFASGVPDDYGSSYFDSMWTLGNQRDRYFLRYLAKK